MTLEQKRSTGWGAHQERRRRAARRGAAGVAVIALALVSLLGGIALVASAASGGSGSPKAASSSPRHHPSRPRPTPVLQVAPILIPPAPSTTTTTTSPPPTTGAPPPDASTRGGPGVPASWRKYVSPPVLPRGSSAATNVVDPSVIATAVVRSIPLYASPAAAEPSQTLANPNYLGATVVLLVTGYQPGWVQAYIPERPNETTAWIPASDVATSLVDEHIVVHLGDRQLILYRNNAPVFTAPVAPGAPDSPTPTGSFFVAFIVKVTDPGGPYGPYALGTSDFSGTYTDFEGGPGQIGIHGTDQPWVIGTYASHGCIRLYNNDIATLAPQIVPGIPVEVEN